MKTTLPWTNMIKALTCNNGSKQDKASNVWRTQRRLKFNFTWATLMLSCDIFIINVFYYAKTHFKSFNIEIHQFFSKLLKSSYFHDFQMAFRGAQKVSIHELEQILQIGHHWQSLHCRICFMGRTMLPHQARRMLLLQLKHHSSVTSLKK
jgi:hypothetical protein